MEEKRAKKWDSLPYSEWVRREERAAIASENCTSMFSLSLVDSLNSRKAEVSQ